MVGQFGSGMHSIRKALQQIGTMISEPKGQKSNYLRKQIQDTDLTDEIMYEQNLAEMVAAGHSNESLSSPMQNTAMIKKLKARQDERLKVEIAKLAAMKTAALTELLRISLAEEISLEAHGGSAVPSADNFRALAPGLGSPLRSVRKQGSTHSSPGSGSRRNTSSPFGNRDAGGESGRELSGMGDALLPSGTVRYLIAEHFTPTLISIIKKDTVELQVNARFLIRIHTLVDMIYIRLGRYSIIFGTSAEKKCVVCIT
jgi:hypothetical protein